MAIHINKQLVTPILLDWSKYYQQFAKEKTSGRLKCPEDVFLMRFISTNEQAKPVYYQCVWNEHLNFVDLQNSENLRDITKLLIANVEQFSKNYLVDDWGAIVELGAIPKEYLCDEDQSNNNLELEKENKDLQAQIKKLKEDNAELKDECKVYYDTLKESIELYKENLKNFIIVNSPHQAQKAIAWLLWLVSYQWTQHLNNEREHFLLTLYCQKSGRLEQLKEILELVNNTDKNLTAYQELEKKWNAITNPSESTRQYNVERDPDGSLYLLQDYLAIATKPL